MVEVAGDPGAAIPLVRRLALESTPDTAVMALTTMREHMRISLFVPQMGSWLTMGIALLGIFLASVGLYGVVSHSVNRRRNEIGVRMSLGARPRDVLALVLKQAAWLVAAGSAIGLAVAYAGAAKAPELLYHVSPADPAAIGASLLAVAALAFAAAHFPARRAIRLDPMTVLRKE